MKMYMISVVLIFASYAKYSQQPGRVSSSSALHASPVDLLTEPHRQGSIPSSTATHRVTSNARWGPQAVGL